MWNVVSGRYAGLNDGDGCQSSGQYTRYEGIWDGESGEMVLQSSDELK